MIVDGYLQLTYKRNINSVQESNLFLLMALASLQIKGEITRTWTAVDFEPSVSIDKVLLGTTHLLQDSGYYDIRATCKRLAIYFWTHLTLWSTQRLGGT